MIDASRDLVLSDRHLTWIRGLGAGQTPPVSASTILSRLVDEAIARDTESVRRRAQQLEIYGASGYSEHHPDYPHLPRGLLDG